MLAGKLIRLSIGWLFALAAGIALAMVLSMTIVDAADAAPLNKKERLLVNKKFWFEWDWDSDWVCYLYDIRKGTSTTGPYLLVVKTAYYKNPFTGQCHINAPSSTLRGGVGQVNRDGVLGIRWPSAAGGYVERISIGRYRPDLAAIPIRRTRTGSSWWQDCGSPQHPLC